MGSRIKAMEERAPLFEDKILGNLWKTTEDRKGLKNDQHFREQYNEFKRNHVRITRVL